MSWEAWGTPPDPIEDGFRDDLLGEVMELEAEAKHLREITNNAQDPKMLSISEIVLTALDFGISGSTMEIVKFARRIIAQSRGDK